MDMNVLFIDDDRATNFFNTRIAKSSSLFENIGVEQNPKEVIDCLKHNSCAEKFVRPHIIFLDINMPGMNGWEFIEAFYELKEEIRRGIKIVMLSTSNEREKAKKMNKAETIIGYAKKPLSKDFLGDILGVYKSFRQDGK